MPTDSCALTQPLGETARVSKSAPPHNVAADFEAAWETHWPTCRPIGDELRGCAARRWVRFHSLPGSKRYADDEAEYAELLSRHFALLNHLRSLTPTPTPEVVVVTAAWSNSSQHAEREPDLRRAFPDATPWRTFPDGGADPVDPMWTHLYLGVAPLDPAALTPLLRLVADDGTADVIIGDRQARWLYHPYDGGGDVFAPNEDARHALRAKYGDWLSTHPRGL